MAAAIKTLPIAWTLVYANDSTALAHGVTGYMRASDAKKLRAILEVRCLLNNIEVSFGYQTADVENSPDVAVAVGSYKTTNGVHYPTAWTADGCSQAEAVELTFIWACMERFNIASGATCCAPFIDTNGVPDGLFMLDDPTVAVNAMCNSSCGDAASRL